VIFADSTQLFVTRDVRSAKRGIAIVMLSVRTASVHPSLSVTLMYCGRLGMAGFVESN